MMMPLYHLGDLSRKEQNSYGQSSGGPYFVVCLVSWNDGSRRVGTNRPSRDDGGGVREISRRSVGGNGP